MKNKKGFIFVETIIVTAVLLVSLMVIYTLYASTITGENRRLRYDDPPKLYETYYLKKYLESFDLNLLKEKIKNGSKYEIIFRTRSDIFGTYYFEESLFWEKLWSTLKIKNIYFMTHDIASITDCSSGLSAVCSNKNLLTYLKSVDNASENQYYLVVEYAMSKNGGVCTESDCFYFYGNVLVGE